MMEFRIARGWRIFNLLLAAVFLIGGLLLVYYSFSAATPVGRIALLIMGIALLPLAYSVYREAATLLLTIDNYSLTLRRSFSSRSIPLTEIGGFRRGEKNRLYLVPKEGGKEMQVPENLERREELIDWLKEKYTDLDARRFEEETKNILENDQFGGTTEEREVRLKTARLLARVSIGVGIGLFFWMAVFPKPYELLMITLFAVPLAALYALWYFKGLLRLSVKKGSAYPSIFFGLCMPVFAVWVGVMVAYQLYPLPGSVWQGIALLAGILAAVCILAGKKALAGEKNRYLGYFFILLMAGAYSYSLFVFSNCYYDRSLPEQYRVEVTNKTITHGKSNTYYLHLSAWGIFEEGKKVSVPRSFYEQVRTNDSVNVYLWKGKWKVPWYRIVRQ